MGIEECFVSVWLFLAVFLINFSEENIFRFVVSGCSGVTAVTNDCFRRAKWILHISRYYDEKFSALFPSSWGEVGEFLVLESNL